MNITKCIDSAGQTRVALVENDSLVPLQMTAELPTLSAILAAENPLAAADSLGRDQPIAINDSTQWLPPIDQQEVWAAGVTYKRSQTARMEESEAAASCYDQVYNADRPEIFFKATPSRVSGHHQPLRIRTDAKWNVPEPEITLVLSPSLKIVGLTVGNDMSSRDIEGENPLYLPQAKCYDQCAGLGPWITLMDELPSVDAITVDLKIVRDGNVVFDQATSAAEMARKFEDLVQWLGRDNTMADGAFLMTGTGIVPTSDFTLLPDDVVNITIGGVGTLSNRIVQGAAS
ncbi:MAG TPA: 2-hydroxyhepta-2,4-diene-1,7-dioate isomerase [Rhodopirellula baltica]|uniref:Probable 2-hydroxyhepta-2,4-diene-1,7-dioate isomaerase n=1 Tax=Rhodopirellula baltica (strain DSM 10527 / NCIMB 13988 / SH1) TaxID=243090 RepID=Q7UMG2_RHOBA|nr:fumarylacetoacetate hydrolase family protein [Rhodopirellula baltica]CAD75955.1 probable 2-hydroxyhepta-2,4-diene-1,7-dioate isomaerase [Rhodopirellula baltica SH 1]HBE65304.1 2-hydroxyhepta-2,4-diene-1,7-dioate isomerase [Rhodopirellula baltica]